MLSPQSLSQSWQVKLNAQIGLGREQWTDVWIAADDDVDDDDDSEKK